MNAPPETPRSRFRAVALLGSIVAAALLVLCAVAVARYGGHPRDLGWTFAIVNGRMVVGRVSPGGPAEGELRPGDGIVAWNGDRRLPLAGPVPFAFNLPGDASYALTIRRDGVEQTVTLARSTPATLDERRETVSKVVVASAWLLLATMIALFRPELTIARWLFAAAMVLGLQFVREAAWPVMSWLPEWWKSALLLAVSLSPLHLAIGYDFYARIPSGAPPRGPWRAVGIGLYAVCGVLFVFGQLTDSVVYLMAPDRAVSVRTALLPVVLWLQWPNGLVFLCGLAAIPAVAIQRYRTVQGEDDRRRIRWLVWGAVIGLAPSLVLSVIDFSMRLAGTPVNLVRFGSLANLAIVVLPISFGYAIIRHQIFDITFVVRRGLQYLLARNALRALLALPVAGLAYGVLLNRDRPIGELLWSNSAYLYLIVAALVSLRFRSQVTHWVDRRFFRESYDRQRVLVELIDNVETLESASSVSKLVSHELDAAFHPQCLFIWYREGDSARLKLSYSSGGAIHAVELTPSSPLLQLAERASAVVSLPPGGDDTLPRAEREWLADAGVRLIVPMIGIERRLAGLLMLGDKKSDEPYSSDDLRLLQAVARQIALARENVRLHDRAHQDRRLRHDVIARLDTSAVNVLKECPLCGACYDAAIDECSSDGSELTLSLPVERTIDGKYRLDRLIGKGGMGAVYEAADLRLLRTVAVKIMLGRAFGDARALRRFEREAQVCARLTHPNIVTIFDYGAVGADGAFLVMEFVQGRTLRHELERRAVAPGAVAAMWFEQMCDGIALAHRHGVVHRDLKPENVLIATTGVGGDVVKVLDFGLAKVRTATDETGGLTHPGVVMGTAGYMAPEQLTGSEVDHRADVFAIGVMAAEAVTGARPFQGRTHAELLQAILHQRVTLSGEAAERRQLEAVLRLATAADPARRYSTIGALAAELVPALRALSFVTAATDTQTS
jgi:hypothetical protein